MDAAEYQTECAPVGALKLVAPEGVKSRFWVHFMKYDVEAHPDKKTTARCNMCGKEISVKQGTGGLKNHLKFKHPLEMAALGGEDGGGAVASPMPPTRGEGPGISPVRKKAKLNYSEISLRMDEEKRSQEKHLMEMWSLTRKEIRELRNELKDEEDADVVREVEGDMRVLKKRKADYAVMLGFPPEEEAQEENV